MMKMVIGMVWELFFLLMAFVVFGVVWTIPRPTVQAQRITLMDPLVVDPRQDATLDLIHLQIDLRDNEIVLTMAGTTNTSAKTQYKFVDTPAVLDDMGMEVTPAGTEGTDMVALLFPGQSLRGIIQRMISTGKLAGTAD